MTKTKPDDISRPVTMYVEKIETNPSMERIFERRRVSVIDIEIPIIQAVALMEYLRERNNQGNTGSIRVRLLGPLVHQ